MALHQNTVTVTPKGGALRKIGSATWDTTHSGALLVGALPAAGDDLLPGSGTSVRASIDAGIVTIQVDAPLTATGPVDVLITADW